MTEFVIGKHLHRTDALFVQEFHIVTCIAIEEIIRTYSQPKEMDFLIGLASLIVHLGNIHRSERTIGTKIREFIEIA